MQPNNPQSPYPQGPQMPAPNYPGFQPVAASQQKPHSRVIVAVLIITVLLLLMAAGFGLWAFSRSLDYKNNSDKKSAVAVSKAEDILTKKKDAEFAEAEKQPFKTYISPSTAGTINITYPRTWSAFVTESDKSSTPVEGYFHPNFVPGVQSGVSFALRLQVLDQKYDQVMKQFDSAAKTGKVKIGPFRAVKVQEILGSRLDGEIAQNQQGSMIVLPLRDKTIKIFTEAGTFTNDFNNTVLPSLTFSP